MSYPRLRDCFWGLFVSFNGVQDDSNNTLLFRLRPCLRAGVELHNLLTICHFAALLLACVPAAWTLHS